MENKKEKNKSEDIIATEKVYVIMADSPVVKKARDVMEFAIKTGGNTPYRKHLFLDSLYNEMQLEALDKINKQLKGFSMALGRIEKAIKNLPMKMK